MPGLSIRTRLALWHALVIAALLGAFSVGTWAFLTQTLQQRVDQSLGDVMRGFVEVWDSERTEHASSPDDAATDAVGEFRYRDRRMLVFDAAGRLVAVSDSTPLAPALSPVTLARPDGALRSLVAAAAPGRAVFATLDGGSEEEVPVRVLVARVSMAGVPFAVAALRSMRAEDEAQEAFVAAVGVVVPLVLVLAGVGGFLLARASLAPVVAITRQAARTGESNLHERIAVSNAHDELGQLASVLNALLARLDDAFARQKRMAESQRQFMADASHELRTPVAALCSTVDVTLARPDRERAALEEALRIVGGEGHRLGRVVDDLLLLARADADQVPLRRERVFLEEIVEECTRAARGMALARGITLSAPVADEAPFIGDGHLLRRLVMILLDNAIKYTPAPGRVDVTLERSPPAADRAWYRIVVSDSGPGVPEEARAQIFERFYRADTSRARLAERPDSRGAGAGLGLAIARWIGAAHGGDVALADSGPGGSRFVITLPASGVGMSEAAGSVATPLRRT